MVKLEKGLITLKRDDDREESWATLPLYLEIRYPFAYPVGKSDSLWIMRESDTYLTVQHMNSGHASFFHWYIMCALS